MPVTPVPVRTQEQRAIAALVLCSSVLSVRCACGVMGGERSRGRAVRRRRVGCVMPAARVRSQRGAVLGALGYGERRRGSVRCSDGVQAGPGGCVKGGEPACGCARPRAAVLVSLRDGNSSSPTDPRAKPLRIAGESDPMAPVTHRLGLIQWAVCCAVKSEYVPKKLVHL